MYSELMTLLVAGSVVAGETAVQDVTAYTSTATGAREFNVPATADESLLEDYPDAIRIDGKGAFLRRTENSRFGCSTEPHRGQCSYNRNNRDK